MLLLEGSVHSPWIQTVGLSLLYYTVLVFFEALATSVASLGLCSAYWAVNRPRPRQPAGGCYGNETSRMTQFISMSSCKMAGMIQIA